MWCFVPWESYNGSVLIYNNVIKKLVSKYEKKIDQGLKEASALARDAARQGKLFDYGEIIRIHSVGISMVKQEASNPSNINKAMSMASSVSDALNEESKKDS